MLSPAMISQLNQQINLEMYSSNLYLQMSSWCAYKALDGCAAFLQQHAQEEATHMHRLIGYLQETGALAILGSVEAPPTQFASLQAMFEQIYQHETFITGKINELVHIATTEPDYSTKLAKLLASETLTSNPSPRSPDATLKTLCNSRQCVGCVGSRKPNSKPSASPGPFFPKRRGAESPYSFRKGVGVRCPLGKGIACVPLFPNLGSKGWGIGATAAPKRNVSQAPAGPVPGKKLGARPDSIRTLALVVENWNGRCTLVEP